MESSRAQWTDARLDDLAGRIDRLESKMDGRFNALDAKFDRLQQTLIVSMTSVVLAFALQTVFGG
jgi:RecB family exonuclease